MFQRPTPQQKAAVRERAYCPPRTVHGLRRELQAAQRTIDHQRHHIGLMERRLKLPPSGRYRSFAPVGDAIVIQAIPAKSSAHQRLLTALPSIHSRAAQRAATAVMPQRELLGA